jgi:hypothetical protein
MGLGIATLLASCSLDPQDGSLSLGTPLEGLVIDGRVANSLVWIDRNNNGEFDRDFEPFAFTDSDGYFSFNPLTNTDYCQAPQNSRENLICLRFSAPADTVVRVLAEGGIDLDTGEPLKGVMALQTRLGDLQQRQTDFTAVRPIISPLTTLVDGLSTTEIEEVRNSLLLTATDWLRTDFSRLENVNDRRLYAYAIMLMKLRDLTFTIERTPDGFNGVTPEAQQTFLNVLRGSLTNSPNFLNWGPTEQKAFLDAYVAMRSESPSLSDNNRARILTFTTVDLAKDIEVVKNSVTPLLTASTDIQSRSIISTAEIVHQLSRSAADPFLSSSNRDNARYHADGIVNRHLSIIQNLTTEVFNIGGIATVLANESSRGLTEDDLNSIFNSNKVVNLSPNETWSNTWRVIEPDVGSGATGTLALFLEGGTDTARSGSVFACLTGSITGGDEQYTNRFVSGDWATVGSSSSARVNLNLKLGAIQEAVTLLNVGSGEYLVRFKDTDDNQQQRGVSDLNFNNMNTLSGMNPPRSNADCVLLHILTGVGLATQG